MAGVSRNRCVSSSNLSRERASHSSASSPEHVCRRNASRSLGGCARTAWSRLSSCLHRSLSTDSISTQFPVKPNFGDAPITPHGGGRDFEDFSRLLHTESAKEAHLNDLHFAWIEMGQRVHRVIERHQVGLPVRAYPRSLVQ